MEMIVLVLKKKNTDQKTYEIQNSQGAFMFYWILPLHEDKKEFYSLERKPIHKTSSYDTVKVMQQTNMSNMTRLVCTMAFKAMLLIRFEIGGYLSEAPAGE